MSEIQITWSGKSGQTYPFFINNLGVTYKSIGGVYVFCAYQNGIYNAIYVGQTHDFNERLNTGFQNHHAWPRSAANGANCIGTLAISNDGARRVTETDLIHGIRPPCNQTI